MTGKYAFDKLTGKYTFDRLTGKYTFDKLTGKYTFDRLTGKYTFYRLTGNVIEECQYLPFKVVLNQFSIKLYSFFSKVKIGHIHIYIALSYLLEKLHR